MNFKRKQRIKGRTAKTYKEWYSDCGQYRISWRNEVFGVAMVPGYHACVRSGEGWGFARRRGLYRTLKAAQDACEMNWKLWNKFLSIEGRAKVSQVRDLIARSMVGKGTQAYSGMSDLPVWVEKKANPRLLEVLRGGKCENPGDPTKIWKSSDVNDGTYNTATIPPQMDGLASDAEDEGSSPVYSPLDEGGTIAKTNAVTPVKASAVAPRKRSSKRTAKKSKRGKKKSKRTKKRSKSARKR